MISAQRHGPWALVGGGSEGIGTAFAERLAQAGINLVLVARSADKLNIAAAALRAAHRVEMLTLALDLAGEDMLARIVAATEGLEVGTVVYNAGSAGGPVPLIDQGAEAALANIRLNVVGQTLLSQHFGQGMVARGRGAIILVGSLRAIAGCKNLAVYAGVKSSTQTFGESLWAELAPHGIDVAVLMIGRTRTPALERTELHANTGAPAAEPDAVVDFAIANLDQGPVLVPPKHLPGFVAMRGMPRRQAVEVMTRSLST